MTLNNHSFSNNMQQNLDDQLHKLLLNLLALKITNTEVTKPSVNQRHLSLLRLHYLHRHQLRQSSTGTGIRQSSYWYVLLCVKITTTEAIKFIGSNFYTCMTTRYFFKVAKYIHCGSGVNFHTTNILSPNTYNYKRK